MHRILAGLIAVLLAGAIGAAILKNNSSNPVVLGTPSPSPSQTYTFPGLPPTAPPSETPIVPETSSPTPTATSLANTGDGTMTGAALVMLGLALAGGVVIYRVSRRAV